MLGKRFVLVGLLAMVHIQAQVVPAPRREGVWDGSHVVVCDARARRIYDFAQDGMPPRVLEAPEGAQGLTYGHGAGWMLRRDSRPDARQAWMLYTSPGLRAWTPYAALQDRNARTLRCHPLEGGRFLLISTPAAPYRLGRRVGPIAIAAVNGSGELEVQELVDLGIEGGILETQRRPGAPAGFQLRASLDHLADLFFANAPFVRLSEGFALVADRSGLVWSFTARGRLRRVLRLFPSVNDERLRSLDTLEHAVLGFQPTQDDRILMATRSETAVLNAMVKFPRNETLEGWQRPEVQKENQRQEQASVEAYPALEWWSVDCGAGTVTRVDPPLKVRETFDSPAQINQFTFAFLPSGNLLFSDPREMSGPH